MSDDVIIITDPSEIVISGEAVSAVEVSAPGAPGPQGPPGPEGPPGTPGAATGSHTHVQSTPATTWVVSHNLGFSPNVTVVLPSGEETDGVDILHIDVNNLTVSFGTAQTGKAVCS